MHDELLERFRLGDRQALARLLTLASRGEDLETLRAACGKMRDDTRVVAITGSAGVGKSTLIGQLIELLRSRGERVAVLACDPQSALTGGALLGDRVRMPSVTDDLGVYIRSLAAKSGHQALAEHVDLMLNLLRGFGFDVILLETVGAGQGDTAVRQLADAVVLLLQPESGDELQWEKAGLLEIADIVVVHKADLPGAERAAAQVTDLLNLPGCREVPVFRVSSLKHDGLEELWSAVQTVPSRGALTDHHTTKDAD